MTIFKKIECPDQFADKVKCEECRCWLDKKDAQEMKYESYMSNFSRYYCGAHRKPYNEIHLPFPMDGQIRYYARVEVDSKGKPITKTK